MNFIEAVIHFCFWKGWNSTKWECKTVAFPCFQYLSIEICPKLKGFPEQCLPEGVSRSISTPEISLLLSGANSPQYLYSFSNAMSSVACKLKSN